jgi:hypothetical protein
MKPRVYLAGKISAHRDWRGELLPELTEHPRMDADEAFNANHEIELREFILVGPFFVACDHACSHGPSTHGMDEGCGSGHNGEIRDRRRKIHQVNLGRIERTDAIFVHIDGPDAYGTVAEIGYAARSNKHIGMHFGGRVNPKLQSDLWFVEEFATTTYGGPLLEAFAAFLRSCKWPHPLVRRLIV